MGQPDYVGAVTEGADEEAQALVDLKLGLAQPGDSDDELYDRAVAIVARDRKCSTSYIQRKLAIGYNKAARLVEMMETQGVVTPANARRQARDPGRGALSHRTPLRQINAARAA